MKSHHTFSVRLPEDVEAMLGDAERATGRTRSELVIDALRGHLPAVVSSVASQQLSSLKQFVAKWSRPDAGSSATNRAKK